MDLIKELQKHVTNENIDYIDELAEIIIRDKINSIDDLKQYELGSKTREEIINDSIKLIDEYPYEYDGLLKSEIDTLKSTRALINSDNEETKLINLIKYYMITNRDNPLPYITYLFIIDDKL